MMDRLTNLPENVIDLIYERLPLIDRVRMSKLSKSWRFRWTLLSSLPFDFHFHDSVPELYRVEASEYANIIKKVLEQYGGFIQEFSLYIPDDLLPSVSLFKGPLRFVTRNSSSVETLCLEAGFGIDVHPFPSSSFSVFRMVNLRNLKILGFPFCPPARFKGFPNLKCLDVSLHLTSTDDISRVIAACPQLEKVKLDTVWFVDELFELKAPKLRSLTLIGNIKDIYVSSAPNLKKVNMCVDGPFRIEVNESIDMFNFKHLKSLAHVEEISLNGEICKILGRCRAIHTGLGFDRVKILVFSSMILQDDEQLQCVLSILAASPNVRDLRLDMGVCEYHLPDAEKFEWMVEKYICDEFSHLRRVELEFVRGTKTEMKIIELLLRFSPALEAVVVGFDDTKMKMEVQFLQTVKNFYRISTKVKFELSPYM